MKKFLLAIATMSLFVVNVSAQHDVTKFLGIPVDGDKVEMIKKLKEKGYKTIPYREDVLTGEFNGVNVNIYVVTNNNKVCRIMVADTNTRDETDIRIRFNRLCQQFKRNKKYISATLEDNTIPEDENISYQISVNKKRYESVYYQLPATIDSVAIANDVSSFLLSKFTEEQLNSPTDELKKEMLISSFSYILDKFSKNSVWFTISEFSGKYYISMYYDNEYNRANGEDL